MKHTQTFLMRLFVAFMAIVALVVVAFETELLPNGMLAGGSGSDEFVVLSVMELATICVVPVALRLFKFKSVAARLTTPDGLLRCGTLRLLMLCVPMLANALLYYFYMNVAFGYMGIILFLCMAFVLPTKGRCEAELNKDGAAQN